MLTMCSAACPVFASACLGVFVLFEPASLPLRTDDQDTAHLKCFRRHQRVTRLMFPEHGDWARDAQIARRMDIVLTTILDLEDLIADAISTHDYAVEWEARISGAPSVESRLLGVVGHKIRKSPIRLQETFLLDLLREDTTEVQLRLNVIDGISKLMMLNVIPLMKIRALCNHWTRHDHYLAQRWRQVCLVEEDAGNINCFKLISAVELHVVFKTRSFGQLPEIVSLERMTDRLTETVDLAPSEFDPVGKYVCANFRHSSACRVRQDAWRALADLHGGQQSASNRVPLDSITVSSRGHLLLGMLIEPDVIDMGRSEQKRLAIFITASNMHGRRWPLLERLAMAHQPSVALREFQLVNAVWMLSAMEIVNSVCAGQQGCDEGSVRTNMVNVPIDFFERLPEIISSTSSGVFCHPFRNVVALVILNGLPPPQEGDVRGVLDRFSRLTARFRPPRVLDTELHTTANLLGFVFRQRQPTRIQGLYPTRQVRTTPFKELQWLEPGASCPVCFEVFSDNLDPCVFCRANAAAQHLTCGPCAVRIMETAARNRLHPVCPICREAFVDPA